MICFVDGIVVDSKNFIPFSVDSVFAILVSVSFDQKQMGDLLVHVYINDRLEASRIFTNTTVSQHLFEGRQVNLNNLERFRFKNYQTSGGQVSIMLYPGFRSFISCL